MSNPEDLEPDTEDKMRQMQRVTNALLDSAQVYGYNFDPTLVAIEPSILNPNHADLVYQLEGRTVKLASINNVDWLVNPDNQARFMRVLTAFYHVTHALAAAQPDAAPDTFIEWEDDGIPETMVERIKSIFTRPSG